MQESRQSLSTPPLKLSMQEDNSAVYMLREQYPITSSQPSQGDPRRWSYPRHYFTGTNSTSEQAQQSNDSLGPHAPNLAVPNNAGYSMFDGQSAPLFQQRSHNFPQTPAFATTSTQGWPTVPVATHLSASSMANHFSFQPSSIGPTTPHTWPASTSVFFNDAVMPGFTSFSGTSDTMYGRAVLPGPSTLPQPQVPHRFDTPSTQSPLTDLPPQHSESIGYSRPVSPALSYSPSLGDDHKSTHARRPAKLNLFNLSSVPELQSLASGIQGEVWFLKGDEERVISEREAELNIGPAGHSIFIAFLQEVIDIYTKRKTGWECRICRAASEAGAGDRYEVERLDRGLKHVRHHFAFKKFHCEGTCGEPGCDMRFISKASLTAHQRQEETPTCPECGMVVRKRNLKRHMDTACRPRLTP